MVEHNSKQVKYLMAVSGKFTSGAAGAGLKLQTVRRKSKSSAGLTATDSVFAGRGTLFLLMVLPQSESRTDQI